MTRANRSHIKAINTGFAREMDQLSTVLESNVNDLLSHFDKMFDYIICMNDLSEIDDETRINNRAAMTELMTQIITYCIDLHSTYVGRRINCFMICCTLRFLWTEENSCKYKTDKENSKCFYCKRCFMQHLSTIYSAFLM